MLHSLAFDNSGLEINGLAASLADGVQPPSPHNSYANTPLLDNEPYNRATAIFTRLSPLLGLANNCGNYGHHLNVGCTSLPHHI